jgi:epoxyqueuosine reductase
VPDIENAIRATAFEFGFDAVGFASSDLDDVHGENLAAMTRAGMHGDMVWLAATAMRRRHPKALWPEVRSIVALGQNYGPSGSSLAGLSDRDHGNISVYARGRDYHGVVKKRLKRLARWMAGTYGCEVKVFVDTAPVMEKPVAQKAGIGWQGKHTNLVSRRFGSWLFLGSIFTTLVLSDDRAHEDACGSCRRCLDICPTDAFPAPYRIDPRRCISYLTIEHKGHIAEEFREPIGNRIFGCDDCLAVCPWNKYASRARETAFLPREELSAPRLADLLALDDQTFRQRFAGSSIKRTGRDRYLRNVLIAAGNSGEANLIPPVRALLSDPAPIVRAMAVWAASRLMEPEAFAKARTTHEPGEADSAVRLEWSRDVGASTASDGDRHGARRA